MLKKAIISAAFLLAGTGLANAGVSCGPSNLDAWDTILDNGELAVTAAAAMADSDCGLAVETAVATNGATKNWVQDSTPDAEQRYRVSFCVDPNGIDLPEAGTTFRRLKMHIASCGNAPGDTCQGFDYLVLKMFNATSGGGPADYQVTGFMKNFDNLNESGRVDRYTFDINDNGPTRIEYDMVLGSTGSFRLWTDNGPGDEGSPLINLDPINTDPAQMEGVNLARLGSMDLNTNIVTGQDYYLDDFESRRQTYMGKGSCVNTP